MNKHANKKLNLRRETLAPLHNADLDAIAGGITTSASASLTVSLTAISQVVTRFAACPGNVSDR
jgi:hypothetical protein